MVGMGTCRFGLHTVAGVTIATVGFTQANTSDEWTACSEPEADYVLVYTREIPAEELLAIKKEWDQQSRERDVRGHRTRLIQKPFVPDIKVQQRRMLNFNRCIR